MFTECPTCQTLFRVTGAILRAGHGQVECGQCHSVFDAIERLIDDVPPGPHPEPSAALEPASALADSLADAKDADLSPATERWANDLPTGEFVLQDGELIPVAERVPTERPAASRESRYVIEEPGAPEEITLEGDRIEISGVYRAPESLAPGSEEDADAGPVLQPIDNAVDSTVIHSRTDRNHLVDNSDDLDAELAGTEAVGRRSGTWSLFSLVLLAVLAVQVIHHYRQELVRNPRIGPQVLKLYSMLNLPLAPNWDVTGYEIQQWGVAADPAASGTLRLRASILNRAGFAQPYPLLKLTLEDRWGEQVGAREFEPAEYLERNTPADRLLEPNQPASADIGIVDPGEDAVGFHVDVCLHTFDGLDCASKAP